MQKLPEEYYIDLKKTIVYTAPLVFGSLIAAYSAIREPLFAYISAVPIAVWVITIILWLIEIHKLKRSSLFVKIH